VEIISLWQFRFPTLPNCNFWESNPNGRKPKAFRIEWRTRKASNLCPRICSLRQGFGGPHFFATQAPNWP
jgi:hypothetical protein